MVNTHESTLMDLLYRGHIKTYYLLSNVEHVDDQKNNDENNNKSDTASILEKYSGANVLQSIT